MKSNPLLSVSRLKELLAEERLSLSRKRGQNFLVDGNIMAKIISVAELSRDDGVLEIGPGPGALTRELCRRAGKVVAVEWDRGLVELLRRNCRRFRNLKIIQADMLKTDIAPIIDCLRGDGNAENRLKVVANLPYSISGPVLVKLLESEAGFSVFVLMLQKEMGERITSPPGGKKYGVLSVLARMYARPQIVANVTRNCFYPRPRVDSVIVRFDILPERAFPVRDIGRWKKVVKAAFGHRRKTLKNALLQDEFAGCTEERIVEACARVNLDPGRRAEQLSVGDFAGLADSLKELEEERRKRTEQDRRTVKRVSR